MEQSIKALESRVAGLTIQVIDPALKVRIWKRAALITGVIWAVLFVVAFLYLGPILWGSHAKVTVSSPTGQPPKAVQQNL